MISADAFVLRSAALFFEDVQENGTNGTTIYFQYLITELPNGTIAELDRNSPPVPGARNHTVGSGVVPCQFRREFRSNLLILFRSSVSSVYFPRGQ